MDVMDEEAEHFEFAYRQLGILRGTRSEYHYMAILSVKKLNAKLRRINPSLQLKEASGISD